MPDKIFPWALLPLLEQHKNLGCHPDFGRVGMITGCAPEEDSPGHVYRLMIRLDGLLDESDGLTMPFAVRASTLAAKGVPVDTLHLLAGSRALVREKQGTFPGDIFLLQEPKEVVRLLQENLKFLRKQNDKASRELHNQLMAIQEESEWASSALCVELSHMRTESVEHIRKILHQAPSRKKAVEALDRGEALDFFNKKQSASARDLDLSDKELQFLINLVRARYAIEVIRRRTSDNQAKLSSLGEKVFSGSSASDFTTAERQQVFHLAAHAFDSPDAQQSSLSQASRSLIA